MPYFYAPLLETAAGPAFEILPHVFYRSSEYKPSLGAHELSFEPAVFLENREIDRSQEKYEFEIDDDSLAETITYLADMFGFNSSHSLGHTPGENDGYHFSALLGYATQFGSVNSLGVPIFEDSRQLFLDLEVAQHIHLPEEVRRAELQAAFLYKSLFVENRGFYRNLRVEDFENWGLTGWALELLRFVERSIDQVYGEGEPAFRPPLSEREALAQQASDSENDPETALRKEIELLRRFSTNSSVRLLELCNMFQYLREQNHERTAYFEYLRTLAADAMNLQNDEDDLFFYAGGMGMSGSRKPISFYGEWTSTGLWSLISSNVTIRLDDLDDIWGLTDACLNPFDQLGHETYKHLDAYHYYLLVMAHAAYPLQPAFDYKTAKNLWVDSVESREFMMKGIAFLKPRLPSPYQSKQIDISSQNISDFTTQAFDNYERIFHCLLEAAANRDMRRAHELIDTLPDHVILGVFMVLHQARDVIKHQNFNVPSDGQLPRDPAGFWELEKSLAGELEDRSRAKSSSPKLAPGYNSMKSFLNEKGLKSPYLPRRLAERIVNVGKWKWGTDFGHDFFEDYSFWGPVEDADPEGSSEFAFIGHAGHGLNSYGLTLNVNIEGTLIICQTGFGGFYGNADRETAAWNQMVDDLEPLLRALGEFNSDEDPELERILYFSDFRSEPVIATPNKSAGFDRVSYPSLAIAVQSIVNSLAESY